MMESANKRKIKIAYVFIIIILTISGFAQMPIFKRYYIADIPGFAWLAQFYATHFIHYLGAVAILGFAGFLSVEFIFSKRKNKKISRSGMVRVFLLSAIMISGIFLVIRNSFFVPFSPSVVIFLSLSHLVSVMIFLFYSLYCNIFQKRWVIAE